MTGEREYLDLMVSFYPFAKTQMRQSSENGLIYYGTGEAGHWAVQSNFNVAGALAVLGTAEEDIPIDKQEALQLALSLFRYNLAAHKTGNSVCSCGNQWGGSWISVLGLERMVHGQLAMEPYFSSADRKAFKDLCLYEADWLLNEFAVAADMDGRSGKNKPEANFWNGTFLYRTAMDYPDAPNSKNYLDKACALLLSAISHPSDAVSDQMFRGKALRDWYAGSNFTPEYSLDHHAYMNVGYSVITLSQAAYFYFFCKARHWEVPPEALHHVEDLWKVMKNFIFPDGRMLRIGGDSRARYCYCQMFLLPVLLMVQDLYRDPDAAVFEKGMLNLLEKEQKCNDDGSFFGNRLSDICWQSRYYYTRLESDPFAVLGTGAEVRRQYKPVPVPEKRSLPENAEWHADFHGAAMVRTGKTVRSMVRYGAEGPVVLNVPLHASDLAEWGGNGFARLKGHRIVADRLPFFQKTFSGGFIHAGKTRWTEIDPWGEGETACVLAESRSACAALPDGKSMIVLEKLTAVKEHALNSFRSIFWQVPNDLHNGGKRIFRGNDYSEEFALLDKKGITDTRSPYLNVDDQFSLILAYGAESLKINAPDQRSGTILSSMVMQSLYVNEICADVINDPRKRYMPGERMADTGYAVISDISAGESVKYTVERLKSPEAIRAVRFLAPEGNSWIFAANFSDEECVWQNVVMPAGECLLKEEKKKINWHLFENY